MKKVKQEQLEVLVFVYCIVNSLQLDGYLVEESQSKDLWTEWEI